MSDVSPSTPRWFSHRTPEQRADYAFRFVRIAEGGDDVDGEARFVDAIADRGSRVLDAGCGTGRVAARLAVCGHDAAGVDVDPILVERGREFYPGLPLAVLDLTEVSPESLAGAGLPDAFDVVVCAGNVMHFVAEGSEARVVERLASVLRPGGRAVFGFLTGRPFDHDRLDEHAAAVGWTREHRFATWQCDPLTPEADWAVSVYRAPRGRSGR
ncbi:MAG: class I SAM-dependent methyltransferase [Nocardioidaceae bacterium]